MGDQFIECVDCGRTFCWSAGEQQYYQERGLSAPKRCKECRAQARRRHDSAQGVGAPSQRARSGVPSSSRGNRSWWNVPVYRFGSVIFALTIVLAGIIWWFSYPLGLLPAWLIAITMTTFATFGYDKFIAGSQSTRVPEAVLLLLAATGGTLGALAGMPIFRHKTVKGSFRLQFLLIVAVQIAVLALYLVLR